MLTGQEKEWEDFLEKTGGRSNFVGFIGELYHLQKTNPVARKELERIAAAFKAEDGTTKPSSWDKGALYGHNKIYGPGEEM